MVLSLAQSSRKIKYQADPRNTQWANDTDRFGHQQLMRMGWKPGRGLGSSVEGTREHVKVQFKTDSKGLGARAAQPDLPTGLDVFQRILGKLNGNSEEVERKQQKRQQLSGLYLHFVPGGILEGSVKDPKALKDSKELKENKKESKEDKKASKDNKKLLKESKRCSKEDRKADKKKLKKAEKASKKDRKSLDKVKRKAEMAVETEAKRNKKIRKENKAGVKEDLVNETSTAAQSDGQEKQESNQANTLQPSHRGIRATRNRYIAMKRKATSDSQSLKEILML